ncbi:zinc finger protein RFP-like [Emydura macquarii macquarii]|uniref:zinc finger protein RFP-like n=1 Tax=Emydura macquarii macquarii TaxID=1129001 RepID=UPI00352AB0DD
MAAVNAAECLLEEATCPICLVYFTDPVSLDCGHNFCQACITQFWEGSGPSSFSCPQCRNASPHRNFRPNRQLANITELIKHMFQAEGKPGWGGVCEKHQEALKLFCKKDQIPICVVCDRSQDHRSHKVIPVEEAAQEYKEHIWVHLKILKKQRKALVAFKSHGEKERQELLQQTERERQRIVSEFEQLHQYLEAKERLLLAQLGELDKEILKKGNECVTRFSRELSHLNSLIGEMEQKWQQPAWEFLMDVRSTLSRCQRKEVQYPVTFPLEMKWRAWDFFRKTVFLQGIVQKFKVSLSSEPELYKANVTLDPETAHPRLVLAVDGKSVRLGKKPQKLPSTPHRFDCEPCVLGSEGFTSGRHYWEVAVGDEGGWTVGVAEESVRRKGEISLDPEEGIWAMGQYEKQYWAFTSSVTHLTLSNCPRRIRVYLDYEGGWVSFYDGQSMAPIFTFPAPITGKIFPFFWLPSRGSWIKLCP